LSFNDERNELNKVSHKLDPGLRKLLLMSDAEISEEARRQNEDFLLRRKNIIEELKRKIPARTKKVDRENRVKKTLQGILPHPTFATVVLEKGKPTQIRAIARFTGNRKDLTDLGITVGSQAQDVFTVVGTRSQLATLARQPALRRMRLPRILMPTVEDACTQAEIAALHNPRPATPTGLFGAGVLIGIIDSRLDVTHRGFRLPAAPNNSRVLYYWVQTPDIVNPPGIDPQQFYNNNLGPPPTSPDFTGLNYGRLYIDTDINTALAQPNTIGTYGNGNNQISCTPANAEHGTHCAGIAAGSGHQNNGTVGTHVGAAPEATIVYVRLRSLNTSAIDLDATFEDALMEGIDFCFRVAQFHNMPIVISVSQGSNWGPHNGSTDLDLARDNMLNSFDNRSIVWSAGNDNDIDGYRHGNIAAGNTDSFTFRLSANRANWLVSLGFSAISDLWLDIWYLGPELDYRITCGTNNSGWRTAGLDYSGTLNTRSVVAERDIEQSGGVRGIRLYVNNARNTDVFTIELRNPHASDPADYHAWSGLQGWWADLSGFTQNERTLADTGCGKSILTVGASAKVTPNPNPATGETITAYSGAGPTLEGRIKPEIVAVGGASPNQIWSANSDQNSGYVEKVGTSMATPLVAGAVALLFEEYTQAGISLNQDTIKAILTQNANRLNLHLDPSQPDYVASERNRYGYGRLRMIQAIDLIQPPTNVDLWIRTADDDYGQEPYPGGCFCCSPDIRVCNTGTNNETTQISWGTEYDVKVTVRNLGDSDANNATVRLKYTLPWASPSDWFEAEDKNNQKLVQTTNVPALGLQTLVFKWRPEASEISASSGNTHFCMLAEASHTLDPLVYAAPTTAGGDAWTANIKGTNNIALRNLHIQ
jgi:subtilisin family serine protease